MQCDLSLKNEHTIDWWEMYRFFGVQRATASLRWTVSVPSQVRHFPSSPPQFLAHTLPRIHPLSPSNHHSLPSSPTHNYTASFLSRLPPPKPSSSILVPPHHANYSFLRFIYTFLIGVRCVCIRIGVRLNLGSKAGCDGAGQLVGNRHVCKYDRCCRWK